ncbi:hypothetical protein EGH24_01425 [Halonotius terrestris]|uniref:Uncharacterized protein n=1 Tax=Halonotius terrestris TaxID=2487750 RepID=A0A8J8PDP2_9EURY|nr:hypothetical protein [Halonotius terrestris]TQQ83481.1 hypothetical protein EGH24_01425 [Halonotius terrestris]
MSDDSEHLANLSDGAGCAEVWEHLSEQRDAEATEDADDDSDTDADAAADADETAEDAPEQDAALTA